MYASPRFIGRRQSGFTLVEMLVALGIMLVLATLLFAFGGKIMESHRASSGGDQLQKWLSIAKQRALRDAIPTGLRLIPDPNNPASPLFNTLVAVQQPNDLTLQRPIQIVRFSHTSTPNQHYDIVDLGAGQGD